MNAKDHVPYRGGQLHQICSVCNWWQSGHSVVVQTCPLCAAPTSDHIALDFGGFIVEFSGTRFVFHDRAGHEVVLDEADYPEAIPFMQRHAKVAMASRAEAAARPSPWPICSGAGGYQGKNPRICNTYMFQHWARK